MNSKFILISFIAGILFTMLGCQTDEPSIKTDTKPQEILAATEQLAKIIVKFSDNQAIINEIHHEVIKISKNHDYDESIPLSLLRKKNNQFNAVLQKTLNNSNNSELIDFLSQDNIEIYWPFSEEWDGRTTPTITFKPSEGKRENTGFLKVDNIIKQVVVNDDYAKTKPVWIIRKMEQELPASGSDETLVANDNSKTMAGIKFFKVLKIKLRNDNANYPQDHVKTNYYIFGIQEYNEITKKYYSTSLPVSRTLYFKGAALRFPGKEFGDTDPKFLKSDSPLLVSKTIKINEVGTWVDLNLGVGHALDTSKPILNTLTCYVKGDSPIIKHYNITGVFPAVDKGWDWLEALVTIGRFIIGIVTYSLDIDIRTHATPGAPFLIKADVIYTQAGKEVFEYNFTNSKLWKNLNAIDIYKNHGTLEVYYGIR